MGPVSAQPQRERMGWGAIEGVIARPNNIRPLIALGSFIDSLFVCLFVFIVRPQYGGG